MNPIGELKNRAFRSGQRLTSEFTAMLEAMRRAVIMGQPSPTGHIGVRVKQGPDGWVAEVPARPGQVSPPDPWDITTFTLEDGGPRFRVRLGAVNNVLPVNIFDVFAYDPDVPTFVNLSVQTSDLQVSNISVVGSTDLPDPMPITENVPPPEFVYCLGVISGGAVRRLAPRKSLTATIIEQFRSLKESPVIFEPVYNIYYSWKVE